MTRALREAEEHSRRRRAEQAVRQSEEQFRSAMEFSAIGMALVAPNGRWLKVNWALCQITGYSEEELLATDFQSITHPDDLAVNLEHTRGMLAKEIDAYQMEKRYIRKDGGVVSILLGVSLLWTPDRKPRHFICQIQDITLRKQQEERIARLSRIRAVLSGVNSAIVRIRDRRELLKEACRIIVEHGRFTVGWIGVLNHASGKLFTDAQAGLPLDIGVGGNPSDHPVGLDPAGTAEVALREMRPAFDNDIDCGLGEMNSESGPDTLSVRRAAVRLGAKSVIVLPLFVEGKAFGVLTLYAPERNFFDDEEIKLLAELAGDISFGLEFIAKEEKIDYLAYYDALTGLPNRSLFNDRTSQFLRSAKRSDSASAALVLLDIERFRTINETFGRHTGDAVLRQVAQRLSSGRLGQEHLARISGDMFAALLLDLEKDSDVARFLERGVSEVLQQPLTAEDHELRITAKAGVAMFPADGTNADTLFQNAEAALKKAKVTGDRYLFYTPELNARVAERLTLENKLRNALDRRELTLFYQPKIDLKTGRISGLEALMRWNDPDAGMVPPVKFIPVMEETGLILEAGRWALDQACADYQTWLRNRLAPPRIAVNVSAIQLRQMNFVETLREVIAAYAAPGQHEGSGLDLEITESLIMSDVEATAEKLLAVRNMGVGIAIDDFGTGYSSLNYTARLPITALKIDRAFIAKMANSPVDHGIITTIISLAHSLKLKVIAEGVETEDQARVLKRLECDEMQGYLFSPAVPAQKITEMLSKIDRG